jgi:hypothetical protein
MKLSISIRSSRWLARFDTCVTHLSPWLLALLLILPVSVLRLFSGSNFGSQIAEFLFLAVLCITGAFQRLNPRQMLIMLGLAGLWFALNSAIASCVSRAPFPYFYLLGAIIPVFVVGLGEWFLAPARTAKSLSWVLVLSVAVGCIVPLVTKPLDFTEATVLITGFGGWHTHMPWGDILLLPLQVTLTWIAIPAALRLGQDAPRFKLVTAAVLTLALAAAFFLFFDDFIYMMANKSLAGNGPFGRSWAASILETKLSRADRQTLWTALEQADWLKPEDYDSWDYRKAYVDVVAKQDPQTAAHRLSEMIRARPSDLMAGFCAHLFAEQHEYEAVPLLMRYSLQGNSECTEALETMRVPQVALAIIRSSSILDRPSPLTVDFQISQKNRERLTRLLGKDAGPNLSDWTGYYDSTTRQLQTPLPEVPASATEAVVKGMVSYWRATTRLYNAQCQLFVQRLKDSGNKKYLDQMTATGPLLQGQRRSTDSDAAGFSPSFIVEMENYKQKAFTDMSVAQPDWNVAGTAGFEREVRQYSERVMSMP